MAKKAPMNVTIDEDYLRRVDAVADARGEARSQVIDRMVRNGIEDEESFIREMENPVTRMIFGTMAAKPAFLQTIATLLREQMTPEQVSEVQAMYDKQTARGKARRRKKRTTGMESNNEE